MDQINALPQRCRRFIFEPNPRRPELIDIYLQRRDVRTIPALRAERDQLTVCVEAFSDAIKSHREAEEPDWVQFWFRAAMMLPSGLAEPIVRDVIAHAEDEQIKRDLHYGLAFSLSDQVGLADLDALARLAADDSLIHATPESFLAIEMAGLITLARAAGMDVHPSWSEPQPGLQPDDQYKDILEAWVKGGAFETDDAPEPFLAVSQACAASTAPPHFDLDRAFDRAAWRGCQIALHQVGVAAGLPTARAELVTHLIADAVFTSKVDEALLRLAADLTRDTLVARAGDALSAAFPTDAYGCHRPSELLETVWDAAQPGETSQMCARLAEASPDPQDFASLSAVLPFDECDAEALSAMTPRGYRPVKYAAQAGRQDAFDCFAEAARLHADPSQPRAASNDLLIPVYAGVRLGFLDILDWDLAAGSYAYLYSPITTAAERDFAHLDGWASGPDPFEESPAEAATEMDD